MSQVAFQAPVAFGELDERDAFQGLTSKQLNFAIISFAGESDSEAYRRSHDTSGMTEEQIGKNAHYMAHLPKVQAKLLELRVKRDNQSTLAPLLTKQFVLNGITEIALTADKPAVRLRAYELLGKVVGIDVFKEGKDTNPKQRTLEEIDRELRERVAALKPILDATARRVDAPPATPPAAKARDRRRKPKS